MSEEISIDIRYSSANADLCARVSSRNQLISQHIIAVGVALGAYLSFRDIKEPDVWSLGRVVAAGIIPLVSAYFLHLHLHNEQVIGLIANYCRTLEQNSHNPHGTPSWFGSGSYWFSKSISSREQIDRALLWLSIVSVILTMAEASIGYFKGYWGHGCGFVPYITILFSWSGVWSYHNYCKVREITALRRDLAANLTPPTHPPPPPAPPAPSAG